MQCNVCGNEIPNGYSQCPYCGQVIYQSTQYTNQPTQYANQFNQNNYQEQNYGNYQQQQNYNEYQQQQNYGNYQQQYQSPYVDQQYYQQPKRSGGCLMGCILVVIAAVLLIIGIVVVSNVVGDTDKPSDYDYTEETTFIDDTESIFVEDTFEENTEVSESTTLETGETNVDKNLADVNSDWKTYEFSINGKTLALPCTYQEISEATGCSLDSADAKSYLKSGYYTLITLKDSNGDAVCHIELLNDTDSEQLYTDCIVHDISQSEFQVVDKNASPITFPCGLQAGQKLTTDDLEKLFGKPADTYEYVDEKDKSYRVDKYTYCEDENWKTSNNYIIEITNGVVSTISMNHSY